MELIRKNALVAKIEKRLRESMQHTFNQFWAGQISAFNDVLKILKTLEVKDVDLEKEVANWWNDHYKNLKDDYKFERYNGHYMDNSTIISLAKHFYELGLKAQKINSKETGEVNIKWKSSQFDDICEILLNMLHSKGDVNKEAIQKDIDWIISIGEETF